MITTGTCLVCLLVHKPPTSRTERADMTPKPALQFSGPRLLLLGSIALVVASGACRDRDIPPRELQAESVRAASDLPAASAGPLQRVWSGGGFDLRPVP